MRKYRKEGFCIDSVNTTYKNSIGDIMDSQLQVRIEEQLKKDFQETAERLNPHLPKGRAVSVVIRELMLDYVRKNKGGDRRD